MVDPSTKALKEIGIPEALVAVILTRMVPVTVTLSLAVAVTVMLLPVHVPLDGLVIATVGGVRSPPLLFATVTLSVAVAVRPAPSVTASVRVWTPSRTRFVTQAYVAVEPLLTLWLESVVVLSRVSTNCVGVPWALVAAMFTGTVLLMVLPLNGLVIAAVSGATWLCPWNSTAPISQARTRDWPSWSLRRQAASLPASIAWLVASSGT